jgi:hypothetical protein
VSEDEPEIRSIPVDLITILNPRARNKRIFQELVDSIAHLGLKKPITVSKRPGRTRYDLVCGQGRLEAFIALGQTEIPALLVEASEEIWRGVSKGRLSWSVRSVRSPNAVILTPRSPRKSIFQSNI